MGRGNAVGRALFLVLPTFVLPALFVEAFIDLFVD